MEIMATKITMGKNKKRRLVGDLLPGIHEHIVLDKIVPKLEWKDFYVLSSVSSHWYDAIRSHQVFNSRVQSHSSDTLVLIYYTRCTIALYSMRENSWHKLPPIIDISGEQHRIPGSGRCILMDGKIYVLGGVMDKELSNKMFMFDLAGQGKWEQRASMKHPRILFGTAVIDGKIYVFGGAGRARHYGSRASNSKGKPISNSRPISGSEVYDPKADTWSSISPMTTCQFAHHVTPIGSGEEIFTFKGRTTRIFNANPVLPLEAYDPIKGKWRVVHRNWKRPGPGELFSANGNLFVGHLDGTPFISGQEDDTHGDLSWGPPAIHKYDLLGNSWIHVHPFSFAALIPDGYRRSESSTKPYTIVPWGNELIVLVGCVRVGDQREDLCLFQSTGFGGDNRKIAWKLRAITFQEELSTMQVITDYLVHTL